MAETATPETSKSWPDYRAVWRWHFYAGLFSAPFVLILAISGSLYLFKPQIEAWGDRPYDQLAMSGPAAPVSEQVRAALAHLPGATPTAYELPRGPRSAGRVIVRQEGQAVRVYVHPQTLQVLYTFPEDQRFMRWLFRLHGELFLGDWGSHLVETAASWTIVMILTGLYLWWPRGAKGLGGVLYPRLRQGQRILWRDLHSVTGVWVSCFALVLLISGLPWAKFWGDYLKLARRVTGTAAARQDWQNSSGRGAKQSSAKAGGGEHGGHGGGSGRRGGDIPLPKDLTAFDRVAAAVIPLDLPHPVLIGPPPRGSQLWTAKSMTANRPLRVNLEVNGTTGEIVKRDGFWDRAWIDRAIAVGIAAHEGQLFGWPNQLLGLLTAAGLVLLCISGVVMWWRRRDGGVLGAPKAVLNPRVSVGLLVIVVLLGIYLPLFGGSLLVVLLLEKLVLCRIPPLRDWLGLGGPAARVAASAAALLWMAVLLTGCGPTPITGGTPGTLRDAAQPLAEMQITIYRQEGSTWQPIGQAVTAADGKFELVTTSALGPLRLEAGDYRCTLESVGAPARIPAEYAQAGTTPLRPAWTADSRQLDLAVPVQLVP
jgi:uncharacterized iron-regulated membrane protein